MNENIYPAFQNGVTLHRQPEGGLLFKIEKNIRKSFRLNLSGVKILEQCNGNKTVYEIIKDVAKAELNEDINKAFRAFLNESLNRGHIKYLSSPQKIETHVSGSLEYFIPVYAIIEITDECNLKCKHCYTSAGQNISKRIPTEGLLAVLNILHNEGTKVIQLTGGEPLLHPNFFDILDFCTQNFEYVTLSTNGTLINENVAKKLSYYRDNGLDNVQISLDDYESTFHDYFRGGDGAFEKTKECIRLLVQNGLFVTVTMCITPYNLHKVEKTIVLLKELGVKRFVPSTVLPIGNAISGKWCLTQTQVEEVTGMILNLKNKFKNEVFITLPERLSTNIKSIDVKNCGAGYEMCAVSPCGDVRPCILMADEEFTMGNLLKEPINKVFRNSIVEYFYDLKPPSPEICNDCNNYIMCGRCFTSALSSYKKLGLEKCKWAKVSKLYEKIDIGNESESN